MQPDETAAGHLPVQAKLGACAILTSSSASEFSSGKALLSMAKRLARRGEGSRHARQNPAGFGAGFAETPILAELDEAGNTYLTTHFTTAYGRKQANSNA